MNIKRITDMVERKFGNNPDMIKLATFIKEIDPKLTAGQTYFACTEVIQELANRSPNGKFDIPIIDMIIGTEY
jgi:hypothetical protein